MGRVTGLDVLLALIGNLGAVATENRLGLADRCHQASQAWAALPKGGENPHLSGPSVPRAVPVNSEASECTP